MAQLSMQTPPRTKVNELLDKLERYFGSKGDTSLKKYGEKARPSPYGFVPGAALKGAQFLTQTLGGGVNPEDQMGYAGFDLVAPIGFTRHGLHRLNMDNLSGGKMGLDKSLRSLPKMRGAFLNQLKEDKWKKPIQDTVNKRFSENKLSSKGLNIVKESLGSLKGIQKFPPEAAHTLGNVYPMQPAEGARGYYYPKAAPTAYRQSRGRMKAVARGDVEPLKNVRTVDKFAEDRWKAIEQGKNVPPAIHVQKPGETQMIGVEAKNIANVTKETQKTMGEFLEKYPDAPDHVLRDLDNRIGKIEHPEQSKRMFIANPKKPDISLTPRADSKTMLHEMAHHMESSLNPGEQLHMETVYDSLKRSVSASQEKRSYIEGTKILKPNPLEQIEHVTGTILKDADELWAEGVARYADDPNGEAFKSFPESVQELIEKAVGEMNDKGSDRFKSAFDVLRRKGIEGKKLGRQSIGRSGKDFAELNTMYTENSDKLKQIDKRIAALNKKLDTSNDVMKELKEIRVLIKQGDALERALEDLSHHLSEFGGGVQ